MGEQTDPSLLVADSVSRFEGQPKSSAEAMPLGATHNVDFHP